MIWLLLVAVGVLFVIDLFLVAWINALALRSNELTQKVIALEARPKKPPANDPVANFKTL